MIESAPLPLFVREALEGDPGEGGAGVPAPGAAAEIEASLLALESRLGAELAAGVDQRAATARPALPVDSAASDADLCRSFRRLERAINEPPQRYAPFFARAAELLDLSEEAVIAELSRLQNPASWRFAGLPGISHAVVSGGPRVRAAETLFVRFKPGVYFPRHHHTGLERVLVLEGSYEDDHGVQHHAGELREWAAGTDHSFKVSGGAPCIFASVVFGRRFSAWPLRALASLLGR